MDAGTISLLKVHEYFHGASDDALNDVMRHAQFTNHAAGSLVHEANEVLTKVGFVLSGRLKAARVDKHGVETLFRMFDRGDQFGMMVGALAEPVPIRVIALEPTTVLSLDYEVAMELTLRHPDLRRLWLKSFATKMKHLFLGSTTRRSPMLVGLFHHSPATYGASHRLLNRLRELGENLAVFGDPNAWSGLAGVRFRALKVEGQVLEPEEIRNQVSEWQDATRIVFDVPMDLDQERFVRLMELVDRAIFFVPVAEAEAAVNRLIPFDLPAHGWRDKTSIAWLWDDKWSVVPNVQNLGNIAGRDFKIALTPQPLPWGRALANGMERLVHYLRGIRIGVALGGGGARGMSHLGVLKALEQNGIVVDMIAGTSAGAMTGIFYAYGLDCDYSATQFSSDLRPSWIFRNIPHGSHWYLVYKYRRGQFDPMLRKYLHDHTLEQLAIPCMSVTVDLVEGNSVVREQGDAVHAILESINLPVLSVPICHKGQALIDGGIVNNIPADVLVSKGCNFVIAVSVSAKMEKEFCEISSDKPRPRKKPGMVQTLLRSLQVQNYNLNAFGVGPADVMIAPDVRGVDLAEFVRAKELAAIGEATALQEIPRIRQLLTRLDPQLFPGNEFPVSQTNSTG
jgi:NTE family protein